MAFDDVEPHIETVVDGQPTGNLPGTLLRSGTDTITVDTSAATV